MCSSDLSEMVHIQKRLDVIIALANQEVENRRAVLAESMSMAREEWTERMSVHIDDIKAGIEKKMEQMKAGSSAWEESHMDGIHIQEELQNLKTKYAINLADRRRLGRLKDFFQRGLVCANPGMTSVKFREALEELKRRTMGKDEPEDEE